MKRYSLYKPKHPLSGVSGRVRRSRFILHEKLKGEAGSCHWCSIPLTWEKLCADHLDSNTENDIPKNLVGSCRGCNANRDDGTGNGRKKMKECRVCKNNFLLPRPKQIYCSEICARKDRPKRGTKTKHGTRSRYMYGCRCLECIHSNSSYWRNWQASKNCWSTQ